MATIPIGTVFGRLTVVGPAAPERSRSGEIRSATSQCQCECGETRVVRNNMLRSGRNVSCGCARRESFYQHGNTSHPLFDIWLGIKKRCINRSCQAYKYYGDRGVTLHEPWINSFTDFANYVGDRPSMSHSIDRYPNKDGNYEPGNIRWATDEEQANNKRNNRLFTFYGKTQSLSMWSKVSQVLSDTITERLKRGWSEKAAVWTPVRPRKPRTAKTVQQHS